MDVPAVLKALLGETGWTQAQLAEALGVGQNDISRYLKGREPRGSTMEAIRSLALHWGVLDRDTERHMIPVMGYVGAGGDVDPDFEQVPFDGLEQIELPPPLGTLGELAGFIVRGESMMPRYNDGDVVVVDREPYNTGFATLVGEEAVIITHEGRRFLKRIMPSERRGIYQLVSVGAGFDPIFASIRLASPVRVIIPKWAKRGRRIRQAAEQQPMPGNRPGKRPN
jgi:transcriptional regulator with XRE-family HTH domain